MTTISGKLALRGTVVIEGTALRWDITAPTVANFTFGSYSMIPLVGDWNGDGTEGIGVYTPGTFYLKQTPTSGNADLSISYGGSTGDVPISWLDKTVSPNADRIGIIRGTTVYLDQGLTGGNAEITTTTSKIICSSTITQCTYDTCVTPVCTFEVT